MSNGKEHSAYCLKEKEIAEIHTKVERIEKVVMDGNGNEPLATCVPILSKNVETLNEKIIPDLQKGMRGFLQFQENLEGRHEGKEAIRYRLRWTIGLLVTISLGLISALIILIMKLA